MGRFIEVFQEPSLIWNTAVWKLQQQDSDNLRELAFAISLVSLGSNQIFFFPHLRTLAASRFWSRKVLKQNKDYFTKCLTNVIMSDEPVHGQG